MTFDVEKLIYTVFNDVDELGNIATVDLNTYNYQQYINLDYKITDKTVWHKISLRECNHKYKADKTWDSFKPHFRTTH